MIKKNDGIRSSTGADEASEIEEASATGGIMNDDNDDDDTSDMEVLIEAVISEEAPDRRSDNVIKLLPVHAAPNTGKNGLTVKRGPGRPRKVERAATVSDLEYHAKMAEVRETFVATDAVVKAISGHADAADMLHTIKGEVAKEAAAIHFQRIENEKFGKDTAQTSSRRIEALVKIANIELEIKKLGAEMIDLKSEKMQRVFSFFVLQIKETAGDTLSPETVDLFFNRLMSKLDGWEDKCAEMVASSKEE